MSFDTVTFWIFFAVAFASWRFLPWGAAKSAALLLSLVFYAWWNPWYVFLIAFSSVVDYRAGARIHAAQDKAEKKRWLVLSLAVNLGLLALFKYGPFAVGNAAGLGRLLGFDVDWELAGWVIPVGISFYTFQTLSYSIDIYRGQLAPAASFRDFFLFVAFFPQLVAGPIVRARVLLPQFRRRRRLMAPAVTEGLYYVLTGLFLKVVVADNLAPEVGRVFKMDALGQLDPAEVWLGVVYLSCQVFADFSGYSAVAIGLAYLLGIHFPLNFNFPFLSRGMSEFWVRWHISLSTWFRDYLYIPMGGNRRGVVRMYLGLMITMVVSGLWHGASWTFIFWGALHGIGFWVERLLRGGKATYAFDQAPRSLGGYVAAISQMFVTHVFWLVTMVFFRAEHFPMALRALDRMFVEPFRGGFFEDGLVNARYLVLVIPVVVLHLGQLLHEWYGFKKSVLVRALAAGLFLFFLIVIRRGQASEYVYFQF